MAEPTETPSYWQRFLDGALGLARDYVSSQVTIGVKTNFGPEIPVARASLDSGGGAAGSGGGGVSGILGFKAAVIVRDASGNAIATYGEVPQTELWRAGLAVLVLAGVGFLIVRGALK